jgi:hypothetical protein
MLLGSIYKTRWLPARLRTAVVKQTDLIAPSIPTQLGVTGEEFHVRTIDKPFDPFPNAVGLPAVFAAGFYDKTTYIFGLARRLAAGCEQTQFGIRSGPKTHSGKVVGVVLGGSIELHPVKAHCLVFEAPCPDEIESTWH